MADWKRNRMDRRMLVRFSRTKNTCRCSMWAAKIWRTITATKTPPKIHEWWHSSIHWCNVRLRDGTVTTTIHPILTKAVSTVPMAAHDQHRHCNRRVIRPHRFKFMDEVKTPYLLSTHTMELIIFLGGNFRTDSFRRNRTALKSRSRYLNRIAYLIATKRNTLKRLALKGSVHIKRRVKSVKSANRKLQQRSAARGTRKSTGKRMHRNVSEIRISGCFGRIFTIFVLIGNASSNQRLQWEQQRCRSSKKYCKTSCSAAHKCTTISKPSPRLKSAILCQLR